MDNTSEINSILLSNNLDKKNNFFYYLCCCYKSKKNVAFSEDSNVIIDPFPHNENYIFCDVEESYDNFKQN